MPRARARPLFELGDQWIASDPGSPYLHRFWTEPGTGRTRRASLGTKDLKKAKLALAEIIMKGAPKTANAPISLVLLKYFEEHTDLLPSGKVARSHGRKVLKFYGETARVSALTEPKQKEFAQQCLDLGHKLAYVARIMVTVAAALEHSKIREPEVIYTEAAMAKTWKLATSPVKKAFIPTDKQCARLVLAEVPSMLRRWAIINALTGGRPQTAIDLEPMQYVEDAGIVDLNPPKRAQNKKHRAKVRAGRVLRWYLRKWSAEGLDAFGGRYCGYTSLEGVKTALQKLAADTDIPVSTYSIRQKVTTVLRKAKVPEDQISMLLGHRRHNLRTTAGYGEWDPDYLREAVGALDTWFLHLHREAKKLAREEANSRDTPGTHQC